MREPPITSEREAMIAPYTNTNGALARLPETGFSYNITNPRVRLSLRSGFSLNFMGENPTEGVYGTSWMAASEELVNCWGRSDLPSTAERFLKPSKETVTLLDINTQKRLSGKYLRYSEDEHSLLSTAEISPNLFVVSPDIQPENVGIGARRHFNDALSLIDVNKN